ncbi:hypothetical protein G6514_005942 [Epicoccum nigrum]|nr:hypothetical protein G6514_005942 [Epicoccum nigrum]
MSRGNFCAYQGQPAFVLYAIEITNRLTSTMFHVLEAPDEGAEYDLNPSSVGTHNDNLMRLPGEIKNYIDKSTIWDLS